MIFPPTNSFTPLSTIQLSHRHILHPQACNPSMDLVVLLQPLTGPSTSAAARTALPAFGRSFGAGAATGPGAKGKERETERTKVGLWRTGGSRVWEVELGGKVLGLAWSRDGLHLSILLAKSSGNTLEHLSVHTGELVRFLPIEIDLPDDNAQWVKMEWRDSGLEWEKPTNGSAQMIIDSLPRVTPVEPPKPTNVLPFMRPATTTIEKAGPHSWLSTFPSILPAAPPVPPDILYISSHAFLAGSFPLLPLPYVQSGPDSAVLALAKVSDCVAGFFNVVLRGLENAEAAFREGEKQTVICREDLEACAQQHAMSVSDVHADLFRFLMTGRSSVAVGEWLGSKLTSRTIAKWDATLDTSFRTIQKMISESITPSLERIILLLEELRGWSKTSRYTTYLNLSQEEIGETIDLVLGFAKLINRMRQSANHEMLAAAEFMKWLKYEITRAVSNDRSVDELPLAAHDLKLVWSFMQNGFVHSTFHRHFPYLLVRPPADILPEPTTPHSRKPMRAFDEVLRETTAKLFTPRKASAQEDRPTPSQATNASFTSSTSMSMSISEDGDDDHTPRKHDASTIEMSMESRGSSPDTVERKDDKPFEEEEIKRFLDQEPWVWARTLIHTCEDLIKRAASSAPTDANGNSQIVFARAGPSDERWISQSRWHAFVSTASDSQQLWFIFEFFDNLKTKNARLIGFSLTDGESSAWCLALQFFDDEEVVLLLEFVTNRERYLATVRYSDLLDEMVEIPLDVKRAGLDEIVRWGRDKLDIQPIPISRCRPLNTPIEIDVDQVKDKKNPEQPPVSIALNGRKGRRLGCIMMERGREVEVLDLEADEDEEEEEEEEEEDDDRGEEEMEEESL